MDVEKEKFPLLETKVFEGKKFRIFNNQKLVSNYIFCNIPITEKSDKQYKTLIQPAIDCLLKKLKYELVQFVRNLSYDKIRAESDYSNNQLHIYIYCDRTDQNNLNIELSLAPIYISSLGSQGSKSSSEHPHHRLLGVFFSCSSKMPQSQPNNAARYASKVIYEDAFIPLFTKLDLKMVPTFAGWFLCRICEKMLVWHIL